MNWLRRRRKRKAAARVAALLLFFAGTVPGRGPSLFAFSFQRAVPEARPSLRSLVPAARSLPRYQARELAVVKNPSDDAVLGRPIAMALDKDRLYIADALDCAVKMFSAEGVYLGSFGGEGQGPGELAFPSGVCIAGPTIAVADKMNSRIQLFDREGRSAGGFKLPFAPDRVLALGGDRLLVTSNPTGRRPGEKILHICDREGRPVWDGLEARASADRVGDAFRNMVLVCPGTEGDFYVLFRSGERTILHYAASGELTGTVDIDPAYVFRNVETPDAGRGRLRLAGFCWAAAFDQGRFYLSPPEVLEGRDLGPGRTIWVAGPRGQFQAVIELPCSVHRFVVAGGRLFAIDDEADLRIFEVGR